MILLLIQILFFLVWVHSRCSAILCFVFLLYAVIVWITDLIAHTWTSLNRTPHHYLNGEITGTQTDKHLSKRHAAEKEAQGGQSFGSQMGAQGEWTNS